MPKAKTIRFDVPKGWLLVYKKLRTKPNDAKAGHLVATILVPPFAHAIIATYNRGTKAQENDMRKLRFSEGHVLDILDNKGNSVKSGYSSGLANKESTPLKYVVGKNVKPNRFNPTTVYACAEGLHAFLDRQSAVDWQY